MKNTCCKIDFKIDIKIGESAAVQVRRSSQSCFNILIRTRNLRIANVRSSCKLYESIYFFIVCEFQKIHLSTQPSIPLLSHPSFCLATHPSAQPPVPLLSHPSLYLATHPSLLPPIPLLHPSLYLFPHPCTQPPIPLLSHPSLYLATYPSTQPPIPLLSILTVYLFIHTSTYYHPGMRSLHPRFQWMKYVDVPAHKCNIDKRIYFETNRGARGLQYMGKCNIIYCIYKRAVRLGFLYRTSSHTRVQLSTSEPIH